MKRTLLAVSALLLASALWGLEAKEGLMKLVVNESNARVSVYKLIDVAKNRYEALLFDQDPRTSFATLSADGKLYRLGDAAELRVTTMRTDSGVSIEYRSASFVVRQSLDFARSAGSALADGLKVGFSIENISEREASIGLRYILDTWLGEKSGLHFASDSRPKIAEESVILPSDADSWVASQGEKASFMVQFGGAGIDRPDKVVLANWKRLSDAPWNFDINPQRNFTLVPYSINDSAIALYWGPAALGRGATKSISFMMGTFNAKGYPSDATAKSSTEAIFEATVLGQAAPDAGTSMAVDLVAVRDLLGRIDRALAEGGSVSSDELTAWGKILDRLEERKKGY
jgi:hypothetical protein